MAVIELTDGRPDGTRLGQNSSDKIGFYGADPVAQWSFTLTATTAVGTTLFSAAATGIFGFQSSTAATALVTRVRQLQANFETLVGLMETAGLMSVTGN